MAQVEGTTIDEKKSTTEKEINTTEKETTTEKDTSTDTKSSDTSTTANSSSVKSDDYSASDYGIFDDAISTAKEINSSIDTLQSKLNTCYTKINDDTIFMGPISDSCREGATKATSLLATANTNFSLTATYLSDIAIGYKNGDEAAKNKIISVGADGLLTVGKAGTSGISADGVPIVTVSDVQNCQDVQSYLDLVMPIYQYYCNKYGIKYPGVLALQPVHEHSAPTGIQAQSAVEDNNLGGLKYSSSIPNATPGSYPSDGTGGQYSHFNNVTEYVEAACWNIAQGNYYGDAMAANNMEDFTISLCNTWVGHPDNYGPSIVDEYAQYGLDKYET